MKIVLALIVSIILVAGGATYYTKYVSAEPLTNFRTVAVTRDNLLSTITATGTVEPEEVVDVGAQVVGRIKDFGIESGVQSSAEQKEKSDIPAEEGVKLKRIDYGSIVHEGTKLAYIDDSVYKAQRDQADAAYQRSLADLEQLKAKLIQAENDKKRADDLKSITDIPGSTRPIKGIAGSDYDLAIANYAAAKANLAVGKAMIIQSKASLDMAETNLGYTIIKSPVEGVIIARRVNIGQTVAGGSLNTPSMFLIAKDLSKMQVWAQVNEADIGRIRSRKDMPVQFTVDAYPGEVFRGKVAQIRLDAQSTQNVVLYTVVVAFDNTDIKLLPYMTANLKFEVEEHKDVLVVPNIALRWKPRLEQVAPDIRDAVAPFLASKQANKEPGKNDDKSAQDTPPVKRAQEREDRGRLWVKEDTFVRPIEVEIGATDGTMTMVSGTDVKEGLKVVKGTANAGEAADSDETTNPFAPKLFRRR